MGHGILSAKLGVTLTASSSLSHPNHPRARLYIKDVTAAEPDGRNIEVGRGVIDIPRVLKTLVKINFTGMASLEYEKNADDPLPGAAESIGYLKGVLAAVG